MTHAPAADIIGDGQRLSDILALAGPDTAPLILRQMQADLASVATALTAALDAGDWTVIRAQTHVLISLAGTIGADRLHALAIDLNTAAHGRSEGQAAALAAPLLADLDSLRSLLAARPPCASTPATTTASTPPRKTAP